MKRSPPPSINIVRLGKITSYEVLESDLQRIADGPPESVYLGFGFASLSAAITILVTLLSATITPDRLYYTFVIAGCASLLGSLIFFALWWPTRNYYRRLVEEIKRGRTPPPAGIQEQTQPPDQTATQT